MVADPGDDLRSRALTSEFAKSVRGVGGAAGPAASAEEYGWAAL